MPRIANSIADFVAQAGTEAKIREVVVLGVSTAESAGYSPGSKNLFEEICEQLKERADAEQIRQRLRRAAHIVCEVAEELGASGAQSDASTS